MAFLKERKEGKRIRYASREILGLTYGGGIRIRDYYSFDFDENTGEKIIKIKFSPGPDFLHTFREILLNAKKDKYGLYDWNVPEKYFLDITKNPSIQQFLIACDYPNNYPSITLAIQRKLVTRLNQKESMITAMTDEINMLKAENYELAQGSAMQKLYDEIKEMRSWFTEILIREKNK